MLSRLVTHVLGAMVYYVAIWYDIDNPELAPSWEGVVVTASSLPHRVQCMLWYDTENLCFSSDRISEITTLYGIVD